MTLGSQRLTKAARVPVGLPTFSSEAKLFVPALVVALTVANLFAALVAARVNGFEGPWLWNYEMPGFDYPWAVFFHESLKAGQLPLWNDRLGLGFPLYAEGQIGAFYPVNWVVFQLPPLVALDATRVAHLAFLGVGTALLALRLSGSRMAALLAGPAIVLCGGVVSKLEWTNVIQSFAFVPWILLPLVRRPHPTRTGIAVAGVLLGVQVLPLHPNVSMLTAITVALVIIVTRPRLDSLLRLIAIGLIAAGIGAVQIIPSAVLWTQSVRLGGLTTGDLFRHTAMPFDLIGTAFANVFVKADPAGQNLNATWLPTGAWGPLEGGSYIGLAALVLAATMLRHRRARPFVAVAMFMILLPIVGGLRPAWWQALPVWNSLHAPVKGYMFLDLMIVILAAMALGRMRHKRVDIRLPSIVAAVLIGGYLLIVAIVFVAPRLFVDLVGRFWAWTPPGGPETVLALARDVLASPWPVAFEIGLGIGVIALLRSSAWWRRGALIAAVLVPMALLSPSINRVESIGAFDVSSANPVRAISSLQPHRVLTSGEPTWIGTPNRFAAAGIPDIAMFSSLSLGSTEALLAQLTGGDPDHLAARAVGIDTLVSHSSPCSSTPLAEIESVWVCRLASARPPYWVPTAVAQLSDRSPGILQPVGATFYVDRAVADARPADVISWSSTSATLRVDAADGWLYIDRAWWPGWQISVDGVSQGISRALSGQLVEMPAGVHIVEQRLVVWDVWIGLAIGLGTLLLVTFGQRAMRTVRIGGGPVRPAAKESRRSPLGSLRLGRAPAISLRTVAYVGGWAVVVWTAIDVFNRATDPRFLNLVDWLTYAAARAHVLDGTPIYPAFQLTGPFSLADASEGRGFVYSPVAAMLLVPFGAGGPQIWVGICLLFFGAGMIAALGRAPLWLLLAGPLFIAAQGGLETGIRVGNVDVLVAGLVPLSLFGRTSIANAILGAVKVWPGTLLLMDVRTRRWRTLLIAAGVAGVLVLASVVLFGFQSWIDWFRSLANARPVCEGAIPTFGPSFACSLPFGTRVGGAIGWIVGGLLAVAALRVGSDGLAILLVTLAMLAVSPDISDHYWLIAIMGAITYFAYRGQTLMELGRATVVDTTAMARRLSVRLRGPEARDGGS